MRVLRRLLVAFAVVASVAGFASSRALAIPPPPCNPGLTEKVSTAHFNVWYDADPTQTDYITQSDAGNLAASAEQAYSTYAALGYPPPVGGGIVDISVIDLSTWKLASYYCFGRLDFHSGLVGQPNEAYSIGFDVFAETELGIYVAGTYSDNWLVQGAASWAAWKALGFPADSAADLGPFDTSLDCFDSNNTGLAKCSRVGYENSGQSRWPFYEYLAERFGTGFIQEVLQDAQIAVDSKAGLVNALAAHGATLAGVFNDYSTNLMTGAWTAPSLSAATLPVSGSPIMSGVNTGDLAPLFLNVDHLATRFIEIDRGDGAGDHPCYAATLTVTVTIPSGVASQPALYWNGGGSPVNLSIAGSTATTTIPWDTCKWANKAYLSLPNATTTVDGKKFTVAIHQTVDFNTAATAAVAPAASAPWGQILNVPAAGVVPAISIFGPELLKLSASAQQIRLIVESSGEGSVAAAIGTLALGNGTLRPGENDLRFTVPKGSLSALRRVTATGAAVLTLTPTSLDGKATGPAVTQQISVAPVKPAAPAKKHAPVHKKKAKS